MSNNRYLMPADAPEPLQKNPEELHFLYTPVTPDGPLAPLNARLLYVRTAKYERNWHSSPHTHSFSELFYITDGRGQFLVKGEKFPIEKGHMIIVNPLAEHSEFSTENYPLEYIVLGIEGLQFAPVSDGESADSVLHFSHAPGIMFHYIQALRDEVQSNLVGHEVVCQSLLNIILIQILRLEELNLSITASSNVNTACRMVKDYIDAHFKEPLTLEMLAQQAHQNKYYVAHTFKNAYGISPMRYLMHRRVDESKFLLTETDVSVDQIASITGFSSASHFSQVFRRLTDLTPHEFRKKSRNPS